MKATRESGRKEGLSLSRFRALAATVVLLVMAALFAGGCGKSGDSAPPPASGTPTVDFATLRAAFPSPAPEIDQAIRKAQFSVRYTRFDQAETALQDLAANTSLSDAQKKAVAAAIEQVEKAKAAADAAAPPKPAQ
jgi:hypothetical protein